MVGDFMTTICTGFEDETFAACTVSQAVLPKPTNFVTDSADSLRRLVYKTFADEQMAHDTVENHTFKLPGGAFRLRVLQLSDYGKTFARALGVEPVENDWEKIVRLHQGEVQEAHADLAVMAAYQERLRGWKARLCRSIRGQRPGFSPT